MNLAGAIPTLLLLLLFAVAVVVACGLVFVFALIGAVLRVSGEEADRERGRGIEA